MKIESIYIKNFRCFKEQTINFDDYTCLVGANGSGKSTVFSALHVFFRHYKDSKTDLSKLTEKDFHHSNTTEPIVIRVTFINLSDQAKEDLADYVRQDRLTITAQATYDPSTLRAEVKQYGSRLGMETFREYFELDKAGSKALELQACYNRLREGFPDLPAARTKDAMETGLRDYETAHPDQCALIPSEDQFYGATRGSNRLAAHIQWVFVPASKDVTEEGEESKNSALGQLLQRTARATVSFTDRIATIRQTANDAYSRLLSEEQQALDTLSESLKEKLSQWAHPSINAAVKWKQDPEKSVKIEEPIAAISLAERGFEGDLSRFGHGLQRSYMLALLQELNTIQDADAPTLILCIEEPELYQHPPQARHLAETLHALAGENTQVLVCSHSPIFIPKSDFEKVRIIKELGDPAETVCSKIGYDQLSQYLNGLGRNPVNRQGIVAKLFPYLSPSINEMFFCKVPVFVEGIEDIAYIKTYIELSGQSHAYRQHGCHLINADKKSNIIEPLAVAQLLQLPAFVVFDLDTDANPNHTGEHRRDNRLILSIQGHPTQSEWPTSNVVKPNLWASLTNLGDLVSSEILGWANHYTKACLEYGNAGSLKKNPLAIARTLELAWAAGEQSASLLSLTQNILSFSAS